MSGPVIQKSSYNFYKRFDANGSEYTYLSKFVDGYTQKPPYDIDTSYAIHIQRSEGPVNIDSFPWRHYEDVKDYATNQARAKFVDEIGSSSSFGATMTAELKATWGTVVGGVTNAYQAARALRRGDIVKASEILGFSPPVVRKRVTVKRYRIKGGKYRSKTVNREHWVMPSGRLVAKSTANKWLWYSYGIKPLVSDIHNGMDVLLRPQPFKTIVKGRGRSEMKSQILTDWGLFGKYHAKVTVKIQAEVSVSNPNLWLANQMGLVNLVQMFNEGIPFSFVIDWFSNLSQIIMQMTDFVGLEIARPSSSEKYYISVSQFESWYPAFPERVNVWEGYVRKLEIPSAKLKFKYERFEWQRGANAISLLVGFLPKVWR